MKARIVVLSAFLFLFVGKGISQENLKIGHVNIPEIIQKMPESDSIKTVIENETAEMENMYSEMIEEHEANLKKFDTEKDTYTDFIRTSKESDLMEMAAKIQQFQQNANQQLQKRNMELFQPVYKKINQAIEQVAQKNNFTYILELSSGSIAYHSPNSQNINPLVYEELNLSAK